MLQPSVSRVAQGVNDVDDESDIVVEAMVINELCTTVPRHH